MNNFFLLFSVNRKKQPEAFSFCVEGGEKGSVKVIRAAINIQILFTVTKKYLTLILLGSGLFQSFMSVSWDDQVGSYSLSSLSSKTK